MKTLTTLLTCATLSLGAPAFAVDLSSAEVATLTETCGVLGRRAGELAALRDDGTSFSALLEAVIDMQDRDPLGLSVEQSMKILYYIYGEVGAGMSQSEIAAEYSMHCIRTGLE